MWTDGLRWVGSGRVGSGSWGERSIRSGQEKQKKRQGHSLLRKMGRRTRGIADLAIYASIPTQPETRIL